LKKTGDKRPEEEKVRRSESCKKSRVVAVPYPVTNETEELPKRDFEKEESAKRGF